MKIIPIFDNPDRLVFPEGRGGGRLEARCIETMKLIWLPRGFVSFLAVSLLVGCATFHTPSGKSPAHEPGIKEKAPSDTVAGGLSIKEIPADSISSDQQLPAGQTPTILNQDLEPGGVQQADSASTLNFTGDWYTPPHGPLPPGPEPVQPVEGWRVQVAAESSQQAAEQTASKVRGSVNQAVHIAWLKGWYKVQVGDFLQQEEARELAEKLRASGFPRAYATATEIKPPRNLTEKVSNQGVAIQNGRPTKHLAQTDGWRIQLMSLSSRKSAEIEAERCRVLLGMPVYVQENEGTFKLRAGDFTLKADAEAAKVSAVKAGFKDAWLVETRVNVKKE